MKERPILFSGPMVRALLNGTKTQTRRIMKPQPTSGVTKIEWYAPAGEWQEKQPSSEINGLTLTLHRHKPRYGVPGDLLWVRETFKENKVLPLCDRPAGNFIYRADLFNGVSKYSAQWKPSIFCTRAASRITLEVTAVRVERLNDITAEDSLAEGIDHYAPNVTAGARGESEANPIDEYETLWESINGAGSWALNPWVWVIDFRRTAA